MKEFNYYFKQYQDWKVTHCSPRTVEIYSLAISEFKRVLKVDWIHEITSDQILAYHAYVNGKYKDRTAVLRISGIRGFFRFLSMQGYDLRHEILRSPKITEKTPVFVDETTISIIDDYLDDDSYENLQKRLVFNLLWDTGCRIGELLSIRLSDIDVHKHVAFITTKKNKRKRVLVWSDRVHDMMIKYLGVRVCQNDDDWLFMSTRAQKAITSRTVQRWIEQIRDELGIKERITPHSFRHGKAHRILEKGGGIHDIQEILGHKNINSALMYKRLNLSERLRECGKFL